MSSGSATRLLGGSARADCSQVAQAQIPAPDLLAGQPQSHELSSLGLRLLGCSTGLTGSSDHLLWETVVGING